MTGKPARLQFITGFKFGLQQPALTGTLSLQFLDRINVPELISRLAGILPAPLSREAETGNDPEKLIHFVLGTVISIQRHCRIPVSARYHVRILDRQNGEIFIAMPYANTLTASKTLEWVARLIGRLAARPEDDNLQWLKSEYQAFSHELRQQGGQQLNPYHMAEAALALDLPVAPLSPQLLRFGHGIHQYWFNSTVSENTSPIGMNIAHDKYLCSSLLRHSGLPAPRSIKIATPDQAVQAAKQLGYPVVVKPADQEQGRGVAANLINPDQVITAFEHAAKHSRKLLVEEYIEGFTHRLTVVNGRLIRVVKRIAGGVVGDGHSSIADLVRQAQSDPTLQRRSLQAGRDLLSLDHEAQGLLDQYGLTATSIPASGQYIRLRRRDNVNAGGTNREIPLDAVHRDNHDLALRAARLLGLDFAGIDLIIGLISESWLESNPQAAICEINAQPQIGTSSTPHIYQDWMGEMFPERGRIPVRLVIARQQDITDDLIHMAKAQWPSHAVTQAEGLWLDDRRIAGPYASGFAACQGGLMCREATSMLSLLSVEEVQAQGLPLDQVDMIAIHDNIRRTGHPPTEAEQLLAEIEPHAGEVRFF